MSSEKQHPVATPASLDPEKGDKAHKPGSDWKKTEEHVLPKNNIPIVFTGLMCCTFLAALDQVCRAFLAPMTSIARVEIPSSANNVRQTIVATALPTIVEKLGGGKDYSWVGRCVSLYPPIPYS